jgi:hypothetical protein
VEIQMRRKGERSKAARGALVLNEPQEGQAGIIVTKKGLNFEETECVQLQLSSRLLKPKLIKKGSLLLRDDNSIGALRI